jgi:hypothetical protein
MSRMDQDAEDLFLMQQLAPGNIVGVHNYCDGWCERCGFVNQCVVYASLAREPMLKADDPLFEHLKDRFDQVRTLVARRSTFSIKGALKNIGDVTAANSAAWDREQARRDERCRHDPILREARAYSDLVGAWSKSNPTACARTPMPWGGVPKWRTSTTYRSSSWPAFSIQWKSSVTIACSSL